MDQAALVDILLSAKPSPHAAAIEDMGEGPLDRLARDGAWSCVRSRISTAPGRPQAQQRDGIRATGLRQRAAKGGAPRLNWRMRRIWPFAGSRLPRAASNASIRTRAMSAFERPMDRFDGGQDRLCDPCEETNAQTVPDQSARCRSLTTVPGADRSDRLKPSRPATAAMRMPPTPARLGLRA